MTEEIFPYIPKGTHRTENVRGIRYEIWSTKQEDAFRIAIREPYQLLFKDLLSTNGFLRTLFFLERGIELRSFFRSISIPFFIDPDLNFLDSLNEPLIEESTKDIKKQIEDILNGFFDLTSRMLPRLFEIYLEDYEVRRAFQRAKTTKKRKAREIIMNALSRHKNEFEELSKDLIDSIPSTYSVQFSLLPLIEAYGNISDARKNYELLSFAFEDYDRCAESLIENIGKLVSNRIFKIRTDSTCLECRLRRGLEPFRIDMLYPGTPYFPRKCNKCGGKTILHKLILEVPTPLKLIIEENRITELAIGYTLARLDEIEKVYIHKKVGVTIDGRANPRSEIDIFAITTDERVLIAEVTTSTDDYHIMENINRKIDNLNQNKIPYDMLLYITNSKTKYALPYGTREKKNWILGVKHIPKINEHVSAILKGEY